MKHPSLRGVNLGGWLIPERWLTPSLFASTNAHDLHGLLQQESGRKAYVRHVKTFIQEADFAWLAKQGVELVRLPVGYWDVVEDSHYLSMQHKVDWAMQMAEKYNLKVLLDLHAAPGSQNGYDHSGKRGVAEWWRASSYRQRTLDVLEVLAKRYRDSPALWGIELLNEPQLPLHRYMTLLRFYRTAYRRLRTTIRPGTWTIFHDAFHPLLFTGALRGRKNYPVAMDMHWYGFPSRFVKSFRLATYLRLQAIFIVAMTWFVQKWQPIVIGEWSAVAPQDYMNRVAAEKYYEIWRQNGHAQQEVYARKQLLAHVYWTYKGEGRGVWHFRSLVEDGTLVI